MARFSSGGVFTPRSGGCGSVVILPGIRHPQLRVVLQVQVPRGHLPVVRLEVVVQVSVPGSQLRLQLLVRQRQVCLDGQWLEARVEALGAVGADIGALGVPVLVQLLGLLT